MAEESNQDLWYKQNRPCKLTEKIQIMPVANIFFTNAPTRQS